MEYSDVAKKILDQVGGEKNIASVTHCMTRLRFILKDESIVKDDQVKAIKGVAGVMKKAGQYQIIIGNDVAKCYQELLKLGNFKDSSSGQKAEKKGGQNLVMAIMDVISGCMAPVIPAIIGAGMVKVLLILLGMVLPAENQTMQLLTVIGDCSFYFLPLLVAFSAGKKFNTNPFMAVAVIGVLIHPSFISLLEGATEGGRFVGIPVTTSTYSSTIIPSILTVWAMSYIEKGVDRVTPSVTKNFLKPALILLISAPVAFIILGPLGSIIGNGLAAVVVAIQSYASIVAYVFMAAAMPFIVMTGMHWAFIPVVFAALDTPAGESLMLPAMLASNMAMGGACMAVAVKSRNSNRKQTAFSSGFSALLAGVTEPGLYGVTMPLVRPMAAVCIASGIAGIFSGVTRLSASAFATPSLVSFPQFVSGERPGNVMMAVAAAGIVLVLAFALTWILGFEEADEAGETVFSPITGQTVPLSQVNDPTFATEILGKGLAILPEEGKVYAPFDGEVASIFETKHAIGMRADNGLELLIHVGLETVRLNGEYFISHVENGQRVKKGDLMLEFDIQAIQAAGYETVTPVIVSNTAVYSEILPLENQKVKALTPIIKAI